MSPFGVDVLRLPVRLAVRVDKLPSAQAQLREEPGDGATAHRRSYLLELERDTRRRPFVFAPHRLDLLHEAAGVADGCRAGEDERSSRPIFPNRLYLLTHFEAVAGEIPISAATWEIGRIRQCSIRRRRPSGERGALASVGEVMAALSDLRSAPSPGPHARPRRSRCGSRWPHPRSGCGRWGAA